MKNANNNFLFRYQKGNFKNYQMFISLKAISLEIMNLSYEFFTKRVDLRMKLWKRKLSLFSNSNQIIKLTKNEINDGKNEIKNLA